MTFKIHDGVEIDGKSLTNSGGTLTWGGVSVGSGGGISINSNANNRVLTGDGSNAVGETNLTFDGTNLQIVGSTRGLITEKLYFGATDSSVFVKEGANIKYMADGVHRFYTYNGSWLERAQLTDTGFNVLAGHSYQLGGTTVIDSSKNLINITSLNVNHSSNLSDTQVYIKRLDGSTNLQRWGEGTSGQSTYRFRIDQDFKFIANSGSGDVITLDSGTGHITLTGTVDGVDIATRDAVLTSTTTTANTAHGWGNHASGGYLTASSTQSKYLRSDAADSHSGGELSFTASAGIRFPNSNQTDTNDGRIAAGFHGTGLNIVGVQTSSGTGRQVRVWGDLLTDGGSQYWHAGDFANNSANWNTAYGWGNHASAGYAPASTTTTANAALPKAGGSMTGGLSITTTGNAIAISGSAPQILFNDTSGEDDFYIHVNSNRFYVLADRDESGNYETPHPLELNASNNLGYAFGHRLFTEAYHPNADVLTTARTIAGTSFNGSAAIDISYNNLTNKPTIPTNFNSLYYTKSESDGRFILKNDFRSLGTQAFTGTASTTGLIAEMESDGAFDSYSSVFKTSWSYAGNFNLADAGRFTETAGSSWITWTDNSDDTTRGNITALAIAPTTGGSAGKMFVYNDQGASYAPGWREIWTSTSDGAGSGLDADKLDAQEGSYYLNYNNFSNTPSIPSLSGYATQSYVGTQISNLVDSSPAALNTLNELAAAIGDDASFSTTITNSIATKLPLVTGVTAMHNTQGTQNTANTVLRTQVNGYSMLGWINTTSGATSSTLQRVYCSEDGYIRYQTPANFGASISGHINYNNIANKPTIPTNNNQLTNGAGYITSANGGNAETLDNINSLSFARVDAGSTYTNYGNIQRFYSNTNMATASGSQASLECFSSNSGNDAFMTFHVGGDYATYFGLDGGTNKLSTGGWSAGAASYEIYHAGNKPSLATLGYTGATNANNYVLPYAISESATANTIVKREGNGYITGSYLYMTGTFSNSGSGGTMGMFTGTNGNDNYGRSWTPTQARTALNVANGANNYVLPTALTATTFATSGSVVIGGNFTNNSYDTISSTRLLFGGGNDPTNYHIGTNMENYGGNYTKFDIRWHTGIRMGAQPNYGGIRMYDSEDLGTVLFSVGSGSGVTDCSVKNALRFNDGNTKILQGSGNALRIQTSHGRLDIGPMNGSYCHLETDRARVYFNKKIIVDEGIVSSYDEDLVLQRAQNTSHQLTLNTSGITATGNITAFSDKRLKSNIQTLDSKKALQMRGVSFIKDGVEGSGVIAQEIEEIAPELVLTADDEMGTKSVAYGNLIGYLIETVKDQQKQIDELKEKLETK